jgi:hypothetical protein
MAATEGGMIAVSPLYYPAMPHVTFRQLLDRSFSKMTIAQDDGEWTEDRRGTVQRLWAALLTDAARRYGRQAVVCVTYKATEEHIRKTLYVPKWLTLAHFGDVAGTDQWKDVRALYVVGRPLPRAEDVANTAGALTGEYVEQRQYVQVEVPIFMPPDAEGFNTVMVKAWRHPHPIAEALRRKACEGALMQVIGRVRGMWRTERNPADVNIWTDVPLQDQAEASEDNPTPYDTGYLHEPILWDDVRPTADEMMLAYGGVWLQSAKDAEKAYPGRINEGSLKVARSVNFPYRESLVRNPYSPPSTDSLPPIQELPSALTAHYRREGKGRRTAIAVFLPGEFDCHTARAWLEERLGSLADYRPILTRRPLGYRP